MPHPAPYLPSARTSVSDLDAGLRGYMLGIYRKMTLGLGVTALVAAAVAGTPPVAQAVFGTPLKWVAILAPLAFVLLLGFRWEQISATKLRTAFYAFSALMGVSLASIFLTYAGESIGLALAMAASLFAGLSLWGYTTKADLSRWSSFLLVGLIAVVVASLANLLIGSSTLQLVVSIAGVLVFTGLTAWDTQRLKNLYFAHARDERLDKLATMGAFSLYLNVINLFQLLLSLFGQRQSS